MMWLLCSESWISKAFWPTSAGFTNPARMERAVNEDAEPASDPPPPQPAGVTARAAASPTAPRAFMVAGRERLVDAARRRRTLIQAERCCDRRYFGASIDGSRQRVETPQRPTIGAVGYAKKNLREVEDQ